MEEEVSYSNVYFIRAEEEKSKGTAHPLYSAKSKNEGETYRQMNLSQGDNF